VRRVSGDNRHACDEENVHAAQPTGRSRRRGQVTYRRLNRRSARRTPRQPASAASQGQVAGPRPGVGYVAHLRWQKPADSSDTLAIAYIRWHRTRARSLLPVRLPHISLRRSRMPRNALACRVTCACHP
jgi:hypothetical protein